MKKDNKRVSEVSKVSRVSKVFMKDIPLPLAGNEKNRGLEDRRSSCLHVIDKNCEGQSAPTLTLFITRTKFSLRKASHKTIINRFVRQSPMGEGRIA